MKRRYAITVEIHLDAESEEDAERQVREYLDSAPTHTGLWRWWFLRTVSRGMVRVNPGLGTWVEEPG